MEVFKNLLEARLTLEKAASGFLGACATLKLVTVPSLATILGELEFEDNVDHIISSTQSATLVESRMRESCFILKKLLNLSARRIPINKLPIETLGYIFSIVAALSPCEPTSTHRDYLLDIPLVCTRWSQIATNTPSLWSHIDINLSRLSATTALGRARIWLERCHGVPIHLHLNGGIADIGPTYVLEIPAAINSYDGSLSSLAITGDQHHSLAYALLDSALDSAKPSSLKTLVLYDVGMMYSQEILSPLPLNLLCGLTVLDLDDVSGPIRPSVGDIAKILSSCCSTLHTLRLRNMTASSGSLQSHPTIPLPQLRFLEISCVYGGGMLPLLSKLAPGVLELEVRMDAEYIADDYDRPDPPGRRLLAHSNVVSLSINEFEDGEDREPFTYLASVPHLRMLRLNSTRLVRDFALMLGTIADDEKALQAPRLQSLCLFDYTISPWAANHVGQILRRRKLRNLAFINCLYPPSFIRPIGGSQEIDLLSEDDEDNEDDDSYRDEMPQTMREWFSERVARIVMGELPDDDQIYHGVDPFTQKLIKLE
ncbi:hypothetical protein FRC12_010031 [Ceratobasidium sp. 428]|nr:hypothetical protein FRC12_010031 [Ceratobasidium sp. 428]